MFRKTLLLDLQSIGTHIFAGMVLIPYCELTCYPSLRTAYLAVLAVLFVTVIFPYEMKEGQDTSIRKKHYTVLSLSGVTIHWIAATVRGLTFNDTQLHTMILLMVSYVALLAGTLIRNKKIPEFYFPGKFDIWMSSHQVFHVLIGICPVLLCKAYLPHLAAYPQC